jgi:hypothetical protein
MPSDLEFWQTIVEAIDPYRPISVGDEKHYYVERPDSPLDELQRLLFFHKRSPRKIILSGHRGSGKSSEIAKLAGKIDEAFGIVWIEAQSTFNVFDIGHTELLLSVGRAIHELIPVTQAYQALLDSLSTFIEERTGSSKIGLTGDPLKKVGIDLSYVFRDRETRRRLEIAPVLADILDAVNLIVASAESEANRPLLVIIDGLDRIDLNRAHEIFVGNPLLTGLNCHLLCTVPLPLYSSIYRQGAREQGFIPLYLPNIKLHERGQSAPHESGFALMRQVVARRVDRHAPNLIQPEALDWFIEMSGGVLRELLTLIDKACLLVDFAARHIDLAAAQQAVEKYRLEKATSLPYRYFYEEMARVHETGELTDRREKDRDGREFIVCDELVEGLYVLRYSDGHPWYDVHPMMRSLLEQSSLKTTDGEETKLN